MNKLSIVAVATLSVAAPVFAQGVPPGTSTPVYGSRAFPNTPYEPAFFKLFNGHKSNTTDTSDTSTNKDAGDTSTPTTGS